MVHLYAAGLENSNLHSNFNSVPHNQKKVGHYTWRSSNIKNFFKTYHLQNTGSYLGQICFIIQ